MSFTEVQENEYNFSELTEGGGGDVQPEITNGEGRALLPFEIVMNAAAPYYVGEVREADGIAIAGSGRVCIDDRRVIRTEQIEATDTFVVGATVYFHPGGSSEAGTIIDAASVASGDMAYGICEGFGGEAAAHTYIDVRPFAFDPDRALETGS